LSMNYTLNLCKPWGVMDSQDYVLLVWLAFKEIWLSQKIIRFSKMIQNLC
jgi:hypothetical protein